MNLIRFGGLEPSTHTHIIGGGSLRSSCDFSDAVGWSHEVIGTGRTCTKACAYSPIQYKDFCVRGLLDGGNEYSTSGVGSVVWLRGPRVLSYFSVWGTLCYRLVQCCIMYRFCFYCRVAVLSCVVSCLPHVFLICHFVLRWALLRWTYKYVLSYFVLGHDFTLLIMCTVAIDCGRTLSFSRFHRVPTNVNRRLSLISVGFSLPLPCLFNLSNANGIVFKLPVMWFYLVNNNRFRWSRLSCLRRLWLGIPRPLSGADCLAW